MARRTNEIGIRLALGAQGANVLQMILRESLLLLAIGTGLGLPLAMMATRSSKNNCLRWTRLTRSHSRSRCRWSA